MLPADPSRMDKQAAATMDSRHSGSRLSPRQEISVPRCRTAAARDSTPPTTHSPRETSTPARVNAGRVFRWNSVRRLQFACLFQTFSELQNGAIGTSNRLKNYEDRFMKTQINCCQIFRNLEQLQRRQNHRGFTTVALHWCARRGSNPQPSASEA